MWCWKFPCTGKRNLLTWPWRQPLRSAGCVLQSSLPAYAIILRLKQKIKMALKTRPKPKSHFKKRQAGHHRQGKHYIKAYLPYLPMLAVVAMGALVNKAWNDSNAAIGNINTATASTRLGLVTGNSSNSLFYLVLLITFAAFALFILLQWYRLKRVLNRGEKFVVDHPWFDIGLLFVVTAGIVLTRT